MMAQRLFDAAVLKKINAKTMNLINGFVHNVQILLPADNSYYNIPELIVQIILMFYHIKERWDPD